VSLAPLILRIHTRLVLWGFGLAFVSIMGSVVVLSFDNYGMIVVKFLLVPVLIMGCLLIAIAKLRYGPRE
jgi:hypothetical protein